MKIDWNGAPKPSRWSAQLEALGLVDEPISEAAGRERLVMCRLRLPELRLPPAPPALFLRHPGLRTGLGLLAVIAFVILGRELTQDDDVLRMKGGAAVDVWSERAGTIRPLGEGGPLQDGDRVRAEVRSPVAATAYWLVRDAAGKPLVDAAFVAGSAVTLAPGRRAPFAQSLKIVGPSVGETLVVVVCRAALAAAQTSTLVGGTLPSGCEEKSFRLR